MSARSDLTNSQAGSSTALVWWLVFKSEMKELWIGGRALTLIVLYSILVSVTTFLLVNESQLSLIPPKEMVFLTIEASVAFGVFIGLVIGADSISGERERGTLETMLLTPTSRRQIVFAKFLAALSPWPVTLAVAIPYVVAQAQGDEILGHALLVGGIMGTLLAAAFTGLGMLISIWSNSNRTSLFISLLIYVLLIIPTQFQVGQFQVGAAADFFQGANPIEATHQFMEKVIVNNRSIEEQAGSLPAPILFAVIVIVLLFQYAGPSLRLEGGAGNLFRSPLRRVAGLLLIFFLLAGMSVVPTVSIQAANAFSPQRAQTEEGTPPAEGDEQAADEEAQPADEEPGATTESDTSQAAEFAVSPIQIAIDLEYKTVKTGEQIEFTTIISNTGSEETPDMIVAMNLVNIGEGEPVDPEDWSPERNQDVTALAPGESVDQNWIVNPILEGDYMVYMVVIPEPDGPDATSQPVVTSGVHLTIAGSATTGSSNSVLPLAIGMPVALILGTTFLRRRWRRSLESG
jgi:ABC-2 type transport system permease protein